MKALRSTSEARNLSALRRNPSPLCRRLSALRRNHSALCRRPSALRWRQSALGWNPSALRRRPSALGLNPSALRRRPSPLRRNRSALCRTIGQLKLFKVKDGIIILDHEIESGGVSHAWTIGLYCSLVAKKRPSILKISVGNVLNEEKEVGI